MYYRLNRAIIYRNERLTLIFRLILIDPLRRRSSCAVFRQNVIKKASQISLLLGLLILVSGSLPATVEANFLTGLLGGQAAASTIEIEQNTAKSQSMPLLKAAINNDPNPNKATPDVVIVEGTSLLSENGPTGTIVDAQKSIGAFDNSQIITYVVRTGDTLPQIAAAFDVSVKTIQIANDLQTTTIKEGQRLLILPISGIQHEVTRGDSLIALAKAYKVDVSEIAQYNRLEEDSKLVMGDVLFIPSDQIPASLSSKTSASSNTSTLKNSSGYLTKPMASYRRTQGIHGHNGVDLAAPVGTSIVASASGEVILARSGGWNGGYGNYIVIQHPNGMQTLYAHATQLFVTEGQYVTQGQRIATVGLTGKTTGAHLHFEVRGGTNPF